MDELKEMEKWLQDHNSEFRFHNDRNPPIVLQCIIHGNMKSFEGNSMEKIINAAKQKEQESDQYDLKPCPFCGYTEIGFEKLKRDVRCFCERCLAATARAGNKKDAALIWNRRD